MNIHIDRSFITKQSNSGLLYVSPPELLTSQAYLAKGPVPIIIDIPSVSGRSGLRHTPELVGRAPGTQTNTGDKYWFTDQVNVE